MAEFKVEHPFGEPDIIHDIACLLEPTNSNLGSNASNVGLEEVADVSSFILQAHLWDFVKTVLAGPSQCFMVYAVENLCFSHPQEGRDHFCLAGHKFQGHMLCAGLNDHLHTFPPQMGVKVIEWALSGYGKQSVCFPGYHCGPSF